MARLSLYLLGAMQVTLEGTLVTGFESVKERALLAFLADGSDQAHQREKLAALLWPEQSEPAAHNNLRRVLSNLRRLLGDRNPSGPPLLDVTRQTVRLDSSTGVWIDALAFAGLLSPGTQQATERLEQAIQLYRGDFLEGLSVADSPDCEEWLLLRRERYQRMVMAALHRLVETYESRGHHDRALQLAWKQLEFEPWWEEAHQQAIRLLALSGRRSEALAQYVKCRRLLAEELDVEPSADTTGLYEQIRDDALATSLPSAEHRRGLAHNLPLTFGLFVGREAEMAEIQDCLQDPACRLLTLVGAGGMGKTRLAVEAVADWISQAQEGAPDLVTLVPLTTLPTAAAIVPAIAQAMGLPLVAGREPQEQLLNYLSQKRCLLILDSLEHLPDGAGLVAEMLRSAPQVKVLVTSRTRLNLQVEHCLPIAGIDFPQDTPTEPQQARSSAAVRLFLGAAKRFRPGWAPSDLDLAGISRICRLVQGMPLGILLAASWMDVLNPAEIADEIAKGFGFLETDWADVPERQRSLRAVFDHTWDLLPSREREVLQVLSLFSGGFTREAAQRVSGASLRELKALADKSLLQYSPPGRYEIHDVLRQYAAAKWEPGSAALIAARDRHCAHFCAELLRWEPKVLGSQQREALIEMQADADNIRAAWYWAVERAKVEQLDQAMEGLEDFYWHSGRYWEAEAAFRAAAEAAERAAASSHDRADWLRVWGRALAWQSNYCRALGQRDTARQLQHKCAMILEDPALAGSDTRLERAILSWSIGATVGMSDYGQGRQWFQESYSLFRELDHPWGTAWALNAWGTMSMFLGAYEDAQQRLEQALAIYRALGNPSGMSASLSRLAQIAWVQGRLEEAERLARRSHALSLEAGARSEAVLSLMNLGETLEKVAKLSEAHSLLQQSLALFTELGQRNYVTQAHTFLASVEMHLGRYPSSREHAQSALAMARSHGPRFCVGMNLVLLGCLDLAGGAPSTAQRFLQESVAACQEIGPQDDLSWALACLSLAAGALGDRQAARQGLMRSLEIAAHSGAVLPLLWALPAAALLLADEGEHERAIELYALTSQAPLVAGSRWFADVAGSHLAELASALPGERVAWLEQRGRARDPKATAEELLHELQT